MTALREVYSFDLGESVGPWSAGRHPGLIVAVSQVAATVLPMTSSKPRGPDGWYCYELADGGDAVNTPIWVFCHLLTLVSLDAIPKQPRGRIPADEMKPIRIRMGRYLGLDATRRT